MATRADIVSLYVGYFNRAPDPEGLSYWLGEIENGTMTLAEIATSFSVQPEATDTYPFLRFPEIVSPAAFLTQVYLNLFNREPDEAGLEHWSGELTDGMPVGEAIVNIISGAQNVEDGPQDLATLENKIDAADDFTIAFATAGLDFFTTDSDGNLTPVPSALAAAKDVIADVTDDPATVDDAEQKTLDFVNGVSGGDGNIFFLGTGGQDPVTGENFTRDNLVGTSGDDTFLGEPGDLITGDRIDGGSGLDELIVVESATDFFFGGDSATSPVTSGVEHFVITAQSRAFDEGFGDNNIDGVGVQIDGGRMIGVTRWEDYDSRADVVIEDARDSTPEDGTFTADITVAMVSTDPGNVDFAIYFDDPVNVGRNQDTIFIEIIDQNNSDVHASGVVDGNTEGNLTDAVLDGFAFTFNGERIDIDVPTPLAEPDLFLPDGDLPLSFGAEATYNDLIEVIQFAIDNSGTAAAGDIVVSLSDQEFVENIGNDNDAAGVEELVFGRRLELTSLSGASLGDAGANDFDAFFTQDPGDIAGSVTAQEGFEEDLITLKIELDDVGKSSAGGDLVAGAMSTGTQNGDQRKSDSIGIQQFDIHVDRESNLQTINSTNNSLQEVYISSYDNDTARGDSNEVAGADEFQSGDLIVRGGTVPDENFFSGGDESSSDFFFGAGTINDENNNPFPGMAPQHNIFGFSDVRVIDASALNGAVDLTAELTDEIVEKYLDLQDISQDQKDDQVMFDYDLTGNDDEFLLISSANALTDAGTGSREDFELDINGGAGDDWITSNVGGAVKIIDDQGQDWFGLTHGGTFDEGDVAGSALDVDFADVDGDGVLDWYENHAGQDTSTLVVNGGTGNDVIWTYGYGDYRINAGADNDVIYADNSGVNWLFSQDDFAGDELNTIINRPVTEQDNVADNIRGDHYQIDYAVNAVWTFNDDNGGEIVGEGEEAAFVPTFDVLDVQGTTNDVIVGAEPLSNLRDYVVTVSFNTTTNGAAAETAYTATVDLSIGSTDVIDDAIMNQAIKEAILGSDVLSAVLEVQDGPGQSLLVWSKIDGDAAYTDLDVNLYELDDDDAPVGGVLANYGPSDFEQFGADSTAFTNSSLVGAAGDDVIVMSSSKSAIDPDGDEGPNPLYTAWQTVNFGEDWGTDTVFHFDQALVVPGETEEDPDTFIPRDQLNFSIQNSWSLVSQGIDTTDDSISIVARAANNDTAAEVADLYDGTGATERFLTIVYQDNDEGVIDNANNIGDVYYVTGGAQASSDYIGSVELIGVDWSTLTADDFLNVA